MGNPFPAVLMWWLAPPDPAEAATEKRRQAFRQGLSTYLCLAVLMLFFAWHALLIYCVWLLVAWIHGGYHYRYAFAPWNDRPWLYDRMAELLLLVDVLSHCALAGFSTIGWWALIPLALTWVSFGRMVGSLAAAKELRRISSLVRLEHSSEPIEQQAQLVRSIFRERLELPAE